MQKTKPLTQIKLDTLTATHTGKVRSNFDFGDKLLIVASDRVSAFDVVFDEGIPDKGRILTEISKFWFQNIDVAHHLISTDFDDFPSEVKPYRDILEGRSMLVQKTKPLPVECIVRGYLVGSGWKEYQKSGTVCGAPLPPGLKEASRLAEPIFTPSTKAETGHDENISIEQMKDIIGAELTDILQTRSLDIYSKARDIADKKGIIIADTKFEFGLIDSGVLLIDEVLTPDSSRFWPKDQYEEGKNPPSFDKQIIRDYAAAQDWDKNPPAPPLSDEIIEKTAREYQKIRDILLA